MLSALTLAAILAEADPADRDPSALTVLAEIALERGDCKGAAESYATAVPGGSVELAKRSSEVALACEHLPAAWKSVQRWRELAPEDLNAALVYATIALKLYRIPEAQAAMQTVVQSAESDNQLSELASVLLDEAEPHAVLAALSNAVDTATASTARLTLLAELAIDAHDLQRARQYLERALKQDAGSFEAHSLMAQIYAAQGDKTNAIASARAATQADPKRGSFEVATTLVALDSLEEAREEYARLRAAGGSVEEIDRRLALLEYESGDIEAARRRLSELVTQGAAPTPTESPEKTAPTESSDAALFYLAEMAAEQGDREAALAGFRRLFNSSMELAARTRAASLLMERGHRAEALTMLDEYITEHPESRFELTRTKATLLSEHGDSDSALELIEAALEQHPQHPALEYALAVLLEQAEKTKESIALLERLLEERKEDPTLLNALGYTLTEHGMKLARAESLIRRALAVTPDHPAVLDSLGWVRLKRGDARAAAKILERAYTLGRDSEIAAHWGEALWKSGAKEQARKVWAKALDRDPGSLALQTAIARFVPLAEP